LATREELFPRTQFLASVRIAEPLKHSVACVRCGHLRTVSGPPFIPFLADLQEWYDELAETRGVRCARLFVAAKLLSAIAGQALTITEWAAGIVGKVWGRQKA
jgi:hypothetical protein